MVTVSLIALVVIAWFAYNAYVRIAQAKLEQEQRRQFQLTHWTKDTEHGTTSCERVLSFADMHLVTTVSDYSDGGYLADMDSRRKKSWEKDNEELKSDGWTQDEWMRHGVQQFEIRRLPDGTWQGRLVWKQWKARVKEALRPMSFVDDVGFKELTGVTNSEWNERGDFQKDEFRPWTVITEDAPSIEAGYQRFIHGRG